MKPLILSLFISTSYATNFIDLGNLEIEGELRRPAINLFTNTEVVKDNLNIFARQKIESDFLNLKVQDFNSSDQLEQLKKFEQKLLEL